MSDLQRAEALLDLGRAAAAEEQIRIHLIDDPDSLPALQALVRALLSLGRHREAAAVAERAVSLDPADEYGHRLLSHAWARARRPAKAVAAARESVRCAPNLWATHACLSNALLGGPYPRATEALAAANQAVTMAPLEPATHDVAGRCLHQLRRYSEAERAYAEALRLDPAYTFSIGNLADTRIATGRLADAGRLVTTGLRTDPNDTDLHTTYDDLMLDLVGRYQYALVVLSVVLMQLAEEASYATRPPLLAAFVVGCVAYARLVIRHLPGNPRIWAQGLYRRGGVYTRLKLIWFGVLAAGSLLLGLAPVPVAYFGAMAMLFGITVLVPIGWLLLALEGTGWTVHKLRNRR